MEWNKSIMYKVLIIALTTSIILLGYVAISTKGTLGITSLASRVHVYVTFAIAFIIDVIFISDEIKSHIYLNKRFKK